MSDVKIGTEHGDKIAFERIWVREAVFRDLKDATQPIVPLGLDDLNIFIEVSVRSPEGGLVAFVTVRCELHPAEQHGAFAELSVAVEGLFSIPDTSNQARLTEFAKSQAPILLFPYVRQAITTLTAATRFGGLVIPPVNMQQVVTAMKKSEAITTS